jgi:hypothetical protein
MVFYLKGYLTFDMQNCMCCKSKSGLDTAANIYCGRHHNYMRSACTFESVLFGIFENARHVLHKTLPQRYVDLFREPWGSIYRISALVSGYDYG